MWYITKDKSIRAISLKKEISLYPNTKKYETYKEALQMLKSLS